MPPLSILIAQAQEAQKQFDATTLSSIAEEMAQLDDSLARANAEYYRGVALLFRGDPTAAIAVLEKGRTIAEAGGHDVVRAGMDAAHGQALMMLGQYEKALPFLDRSISTYEAAGANEMSITARRHRGTIFRFLGDLAMAYTCAMEAVDLARTYSNKRGEALALYDLGTIHMVIGNLADAFSELYASLHILEEVGTPSEIANTLSQIGSTYAAFQDIDRARETLLRAADILGSIGNKMGVINTYGNLGITLMNADRSDEAVEWLEKAIEEARLIGAEHQRVFFTESLVTALVGAGRADEGLELLDREQAHFAPYFDTVVSSHVARSHILMVQGKLDEARDLLTSTYTSVETDPRIELRLSVVNALRDLMRARQDFDGYLRYDAEAKEIENDLRGKATAKKILLQEKERELSVLQREHNKQLNVLYAALPKHVAERVARGETVNDVHPHAAVLFLDLVGYTTQSSALTASETADVLSDVFTHCDGICEHYDVVKIKTIGDSYMAVAFDNTSTETPSVERLVRAAQQMFQHRYTWPSGDPVVFRCGIHCGPVVAGVLGNNRLQYDVWGDIVNVASRMESTSEPGRIHITHDVATVLRNTSIPITERGKVDVKGKGEMETWWVMLGDAG